MASIHEERTPIDLNKAIDYPFAKGFGFGKLFDFKNYYQRELKQHLFSPLDDQKSCFFDEIFAKKEHKRLVDLFRIIDETQKLGELDEDSLKKIREISTLYFSKIQYMRQMGYDPLSAWDNSLKVRMSSFVDFNTDQKNTFFDDIILVLQESINNPNEKMPNELQACFVHIERLKYELLEDFVTYLFEKDAVFAEIIHANSSLPRSIFQAFENKKLSIIENEYIEHDCSDQHHSVEPEPEDEEYSEYSSENTTPIKNRFFCEDQWVGQRTGIILGAFNTQPETVSADLMIALDELAIYANEELEKEGHSPRVSAGHQKYNELVALFNEFGKIRSNSSLEALKAARDILVEHLEKDPKESELLKNRGGFLGIYKTFSKIYSRVGLLHYSFRKQDGTKRAAVSTTDHLLIQLLDAMNDELELLSPGKVIILT